MNIAQLEFLIKGVLVGCCLTSSVNASSLLTDPVALQTNECNGQRGFEVDIPIIKTFDEFRESVSWQDPQAIDVNGKIVIYQQLLMVNEPDKGIHIFDNEDPQNPVALGFLSIPGNTDFMVRNDTIYADSIIDLVLVDISNFEDVREIGRSQNIYKVNRNRFGSFWINGKPVTFDSSKEIIIGKNTVCINY